jgi:hypothetical protein
MVWVIGWLCIKTRLTANRPTVTTLSIVVERLHRVAIAIKWFTFRVVEWVLIWTHTLARHLFSGIIPWWPRSATEMMFSERRARSAVCWSLCLLLVLAMALVKITA